MLTLVNILKPDKILLKNKETVSQKETAPRNLQLLSIINIEKFAKIDVFRQARKGIPEIIFAEYKTPEQIIKIIKKTVRYSKRVIMSRLTSEHVKELKKLREFKVEVFENAQMAIVSLPNTKRIKTGGKAGILTAGTADICIAEEASIVLKEAGCEVYTTYDIGIAGFHRFLNPLKKMILKDVDVIIVVAGMEGALPSIVSSIANCPIIGVPSSSGYGYGGQGQAALMSMLQSCSPGLAVVNIDNGIGAGALASIIANRMAKARKTVKNNI